jgi:hypothetical protein
MLVNVLTCAVGAFSLPFGRVRTGGRAVLSINLFNCVPFSAQSAENGTQKMDIYLAAGSPELVEGQAKLRIN